MISSQQLSRELNGVVLDAGADFVGFADIDGKGGLPHCDLRTAISIGIVYGKAIDDLNVEGLHEYIVSTKRKMSSILDITARHLQGRQYKTWVPQISETLTGLYGEFSHKMAATMSGLGWVGKNSIFVSREFGCGSRLATIFTDAEVVCGKPIIRSQCGSCDKCVRACPCNAIKGSDWHAGISREELLDPWMCKRYRDSYKEKLGFSHPCCLCIMCCPYSAEKS